MWRRRLHSSFYGAIVFYFHLCYNCLAMAKKGDKRKIIGLICEACSQRHYYTTKNSMNTPEKVELIKYCPIKRAQAKQVETKKSLGRNEAPKR